MIGGGAAAAVVTIGTLTGALGTTLLFDLDTGGVEMIRAV
jgi:hypothetical protein